MAPLTITEVDRLTEHSVLPYAAAATAAADDWS